MGGAVYAPSSKMELKEFQMLIDGMMYKTSMTLKRKKTETE